MDRGAWYGVLICKMFSVSEHHAECAWPARSVTVPHGSASYAEGIEALNGPRGCGPRVDNYARTRFAPVGVQLGVALKRSLEKVGRLYFWVFAHYSKVEPGP